MSRLANHPDNPPEPVVGRDLCDMASSAGDIEFKARWAGKLLGEAFEDLRDEPRAIADALADLREARRLADALIAELEGLK